MLDICRTVKHRVDRKRLKRLKVFIIRHIAVQNLDARLEFPVQIRAEVVEQNALKTLAGGVEFALAHHTPGFSALFPEILSQQMRTHVAGCAGDQHIAKLTQRFVPERFHGIFRQKRINFGIIIIVKIEELLHVVDIAVLEQLRQRTRRRVFEDISIGDLIAIFRGIEYDLGNDERGSANLKEVIGCANAVELQRLPEGFAEEFLRGIGRRDILAEVYGNRVGQALYIGFPAGIHRQLVELEVCRRHHIMRQMLPEFISQSVNINLSVSGKIRAKIVLAVELADADRDLPDMRLNGDQALNLTQFDPEASELDLAVQPAEDPDEAVFVPPGIVA